MLKANYPQLYSQADGSSFTYNADQKRRIDKFANGAFQLVGMGSLEQQSTSGRIQIRPSDGYSQHGEWLNNLTAVTASDLKTPPDVQKAYLPYYNSFDRDGIAVSGLNNRKWWVPATAPSTTDENGTAPAQGASEGLSTGLSYNLTSWTQSGRYVARASDSDNVKKVRQQIKTGRP